MDDIGNAPGFIGEGVMMEAPVVGTQTEYIEPPRTPGDRRGFAGILAAQRFPIVPDLPVPPTVPERAVLEDRKHIDTGWPPTHRGRWGSHPANSWNLTHS